jgi:hypothetical protein
MIIALSIVLLLMTILNIVYIMDSSDFALALSMILGFGATFSLFLYWGQFLP